MKDKTRKTRIQHEKKNQELRREDIQRKKEQNSWNKRERKEKMAKDVESDEVMKEKK